MPDLLPPSGPVDAGVPSVTDAPGLDKAPIGQVLTALAVDPAKGLSAAEAGTRLAKYGPNANAHKQESLLAKAVTYFRGPMALMAAIQGPASAAASQMPHQTQVSPK